LRDSAYISGFGRCERRSELPLLLEQMGWHVGRAVGNRRGRILWNLDRADPTNWGEGQLPLVHVPAFVCTESIRMGSS